MTKCIVIGEQPTQEKKKPIEFVNALAKNPMHIHPASSKPKNFRNVELIAGNCYSGFDVMFAYDDERLEGVIYLGHWNDGVAE